MDGPLPLKLTGRHPHFSNSTCNIGPSDMRQGSQNIVTWEIITRNKHLILRLKLISVSAYYTFLCILQCSFF